jgi:non-canonical purine NTP pyrophosphatase (RdgB/HAM1 family)
MKKIVLASNNAGKLREFGQMLATIDIEVLPQAHFAIPEAEEPHVTFVENALAKARHAAKLTGLPALADDSGICVSALGGAPGVFSARFAGEPKSDERNNQKLIADLQGLGPDCDRRAHYVAVLVFVHHADDPQPIICEGEWHGEIIDTPRGANGFGYDPYFLVPDLNQTAAEIAADEKNLASRQSAPAAGRTAEARRLRRTIPIAAVPSAPTFPPAVSGLAAPPPLSLYVHWPWCVKKCPYCDFNSHESAPDEAAYLAALVADLEAALPTIWNRPVGSVFIGGGTPSLMSAATLDALLAAVRMRVPLHPDAEITLEANPGTAEAGKFAAFRAAGVNRLSLGIQSFDDRKLAALGRIHGGDEARRAIEFAQRHFERVNLDLMYGLPGQTLAAAEADIAEAVATGVEHVSAYHLTLEPNTAFHHAPPALPDDDLAADMQEAVEARLAAAGFDHYETSAFARHGRRCRHNLNYWTFGDYLGIGAGAHSKLSDHARIWREARHRHPKAYLEGAARGDFVASRADIAAADLPGEFMMNALRLSDGFPLPLFAERTGLSPTVWENPALAGRREGLLEVADGWVRPTAAGRRFLNRLLQYFL